MAWVWVEYGMSMGRVFMSRDRIPQNLLTEDEVLLQYYDIASSKV